MSVVLMPGMSCSGSIYPQMQTQRHWVLINYFFHPQTKLRKGNVFTPVCDSVYRGIAWQGEVYVALQGCICRLHVYRIQWSCEGLTSVTQRIRWIHFEAFIAETYVQLVATEATCYSTGWSALPGVGVATVRMSWMLMRRTYCTVA